MEPAKIIQLPEGVCLNDFRPVAYFDKRMDCIRVLTQDCSFTEHRLDGLFTVYESNHVDVGPKYVGFCIKGVRSLFKEVGLPLEGPHKLAEVIDKLVKHRPGTTMSTVLDMIFFLQYDAASELEIEFENAA